jgi:putative ABC transport system permease protein
MEATRCPRRALSSNHLRKPWQLHGEAALLGILGGAVGVAVGVGATIAYASARDWAVVIPTLAWAGGLGAAIAIGALAGLLPALRAARLSPTEALRTG